MKSEKNCFFFLQIVFWFWTIRVCKMHVVCAVDLVKTGGEWWHPEIGWVWDRYDRRTDPIKNRVKGFLGWSVGAQGFARSLRCFLFRFAFASLSPSLFPPKCVCCLQFPIVHDFSRDYPILELCTTSKQARISGTFQLSLVRILFFEQ
jgi:hypothetical protein